MTRFLIAGALLLAASVPALAQDMPLSQILIDGEGWKKVDGKGEKPSEPPSWPIMVFSVDRGTLFMVRSSQQRFIFAGPVAEGQSVPLGTPFAPLRTKDGQVTIEVTSVVADKDGRVYAATDIGVQVFDPTGRLCGVLTPAAPGRPENMAFEGDKLALWIGVTKYTRKLNTRGAK